VKAYMRDKFSVKESAFYGALTAADLCYLLALRDEGFGSERLKRITKKARDYYDEYRDRYCLDCDIRSITQDSPHLLAMKEELKTCGYDYEDDMRRYDASKSRWHGNNTVERI